MTEQKIAVFISNSDRKLKVFTEEDAIQTQEEPLLSNTAYTLIWAENKNEALEKAAMDKVFVGKVVDAAQKAYFQYEEKPEKHNKDTARELQAAADILQRIQENALFAQQKQERKQDNLIEGNHSVNLRVNKKLAEKDGRLAL